MSLRVTFKMVIFVLPNVLFAGIIGGSDRQKGIDRLFEEYRIRPNDKCGFHIIAQYYGTPGDRFNIKKILQLRPLNDTSVVSPSGKFRIHFDTTNVNGNQPFLYDSTGQIIPNSTFAFVDSIKKICDYVYHAEVDSLGYPPPPSDSGEGGGDEYDIYIQFLTPGIYGDTRWDTYRPLTNRASNPTYAAWTLIRNEFQSTYTKGISAIEVTIAHEFHHGIQIGNYGLRGENDGWFYELTSTWMEQVVYPQVMDYYQYLSDFFNNVDVLAFDAVGDGGYERSVFGIFVQNEYGTFVMKSIWENMVREEPIQAIVDAFSAIGKDPSSMFQLFGEVNYFTNYRTTLASNFNIIPYPLSRDYPSVKISGTADIAGSSGGASFSNTATRLTEHYYQIYDGTDTIGLAVVNTNFSAAINSDTTNFSFSAGISSNGNSNCVRNFANGYCLFFTVADHTDWGLAPFITNQNFAVINDKPYPQPFNPSLFSQLKIPNSFPGAVNITLSIFSASGILVQEMNSTSSANYSGKYFNWNGRDRMGKIVSSGVYIYVLSDGSKSVVGKIAVVRN